MFDEVEITNRFRILQMKLFESFGLLHILLLFIRHNAEFRKYDNDTVDKCPYNDDPHKVFQIPFHFPLTNGRFLFLPRTLPQPP